MRIERRILLFCLSICLTAFSFAKPELDSVKIVHDLDKVLLYTVWPHKKVKNFHRSTARHHIESKSKKTRADYIEMIIDWECARYTKPDKPLNAYDTLYKWYPNLEKEILPILKEFNIAHHTVKE